jgi:SAM-dependent methyltransferase
MIGKDKLRENLKRFTWKAYNLLPPLPKPRILELGCGQGAATIELAVLSKGTIDAIDGDGRVLAELREKAAALRLSHCIRTKKGNIARPPMKKGAYDIVWSEGSIGRIGFENGLREWKRFLAPGGHLVVHDERGNLDDKKAAVLGCGCTLVAHFIITPDIWLREYFRPLEQRIADLIDEHLHDADIVRFLESEREEVEQFKDDPNRFASVFLVMKEKAESEAE